jgi:hypothetical protein
MAVQGNLITPYFVEVNLLEPAAYGDLVTPFEMDDPIGIVGVNLTNRFPTPPVAWGFLVDVEDAVGPIVGLSGRYTIIGAVYPESDYLEPTIGQIWPRIG